jgi:PqqD family protein of HPr-rel-A system
MRFRCTAGTLLHDTGECIFAFSAFSGETHIINDSGAALLDCLADGKQFTQVEIVSEMAALYGVESGEVANAVEQALRDFLEAGLIEVAPAPAT